MKKIFLILFGLLTFCLLIYLTMFVISQKKYPVEYGISFNKDHASSLGLNWQEVYTAMLDELQPKYLRIAATWSEVENQKGNYWSEDMDWQFREAQKRNAKLVLVVGQKAPRWPECHVPDWTKDLTDEEYKQKLLDYVTFVVNKYKDNEALEIWQVENEPFIRFKFGECKNFRSDLIKDEIDLVKQLDPEHKIIVTDSGELSTWRKASRAGDLFGTTMYRIVRTPKGNIFTYDWLPAGFYKLKAWFWGRSRGEVFVSELQAEPWFTDGSPLTTSIKEQEETMNIERINKHFDFVEKIGYPRAYLWGVEWWYWMHTQGETGYWELVKEKIKR